MNFENKKVLITGGNGFIGSNLAEKIQKLGGSVDIYDLSGGNDILDKNNLKRAIKKKYDFIYNFAGFSGSEESNRSRLKCFSLNTLSLLELFEFTLKYSPGTKIILSGSRLEYGIPEYIPVDEDHSTIPISFYGLSKLAATQLAQIYSNTHELNVTIFRTSNTYGPHKKRNFPGYNLINYFIDQAEKNAELTIFGDGSQQRDYIYIDDLTDAFLLAANYRSSAEIYNLGYGRGITIKEMAEMICKIVGKGKLSFKKWPETHKNVETGSYISNIQKIKTHFGFVPKVDFEKGIKKTCEKS